MITFSGCPKHHGVAYFYFDFFSPHLDYHLLLREKHSGGQLEPLREKTLAKDSQTLLLHGHVFISEEGWGSGQQKGKSRQQLFYWASKQQTC